MKTSILSLLVAIGVGVPALRADAASPDSYCADVIRGAQELEAAGRLSAARARLSACMTGACTGTARQECAARIAAVDAALPRVTLVVKDGDGHDLRGARVTLDGKPLVDRVEGGSISVDPGEHHFQFQVVGFSPIETTLVARAGEQKLRVMVFLNRESALAVAAAPNEPSLALPAPAVSPPAGPSPESTETGAAMPRWQKRVAVALVGAAAGSLVLGTVWAFLAKAKYDHALTTECGGDPNSCSPRGIADGRTAHDRALVATVGFVGAAVFLVGAAGVYFVWPMRQERITVAPAVTGQGAGVALSW